MAIEFTRFPLLPEELRIEIWRYCLPGPRIIHLRVSWMKKTHWRWVTNAKFPELLRASHEARRVTLELYEPIWAWDHSRTPWGRCLIDYSRDVMMFNDVEFLALKSGRILDPPTEPSKTQSLAILPEHGSWPRMIPGDDRGFDSKLEPRATEYLVSVIGSFVNLRQIFLIIDGRHDGFVGLEELLEPTAEPSSSEGPRTKQFAWISSYLAEVKSMHPNLDFPKVQLAISVNKDTKDNCGQWDYDYTLWNFRSAGSLGNNAISEPDYEF